MDMLTNSIKENMLYVVESKEYIDEAAKSSIPSGFDPKEHADKLMNRTLWKSNHYSYGVKAAQKRKDKETYDAELGKKAGFNLSKLGDSRLGTKLNAAQHRAVGEHIAKNIEKEIGLKEDDLQEGKLPDWAQKEFDSAFTKKSKKVVDNSSDEWSPKSTAAEKITNARKAKAQTGAEARAKVTRTILRTKQYDVDQDEIIGHTHEHPTGMPDKNPQHAAAPELMKAFGLHVRGIDAKKAAAPKRPKGKAATPEAMKAYRKALQAHLKESVEQLDELSLDTLLRTKERGEHLAKMGKAHKAKDEKLGAAYEKYGKKLTKKVVDHISKGYFTKEEIELDEGVKIETIKSAERPKGIGWVLKQAKEQTGKPHSVWERKIKKLEEGLNEAKVGTETNGSSDNARSFARKGTGDPKQELTTKFNAITDGDINKCKVMLGSDAKNLPEAFDGDAAMRNDNYSHSSENRTVAPKKVKKIGLFNKAGQHVRSYHETEVAKAKAHAQSGGFTMRRVEEEVENIFDVNIVKEGFQYYYDILFEDEVLAEGVASTEAGAHAQVNRFVEKLIEDAINEENQIDRVKNIINKYIK